MVCVHFVIMTDRLDRWRSRPAGGGRGGGVRGPSGRRAVAEEGEEPFASGGAAQASIDAVVRRIELAGAAHQPCLVTHRHIAADMVHGFPADDFRDDIRLQRRLSLQTRSGPDVRFFLLSNQQIARKLAHGKHTNCPGWAAMPATSRCCWTCPRNVVETLMREAGERK